MSSVVIASTILSYDLVNEPAKAGTFTGTKEWKVMDKLYEAIREVDEDHIITLEGCWMFNNLPDPKKYGWENVMYEFHLYNWSKDYINNDLFYAFNFATWMMSDYDVPKFMGEFTLFDDKEEWVKWLNEYDARGLNWTIWSYKTICVGWWDMSWGIYIYKMNLQNEQLKLDVRTATYEEIKAVWSKQGTSETYKDTGVLKEALDEYFKK